MIGAKVVVVGASAASGLATWLATQAAQMPTLPAWFTVGTVVTLSGVIGGFAVTRQESKNAHARITKFQDEYKDDRREFSETLSGIQRTVEQTSTDVAVLLDNKRLREAGLLRSRGGESA